MKHFKFAIPTALLLTVLSLSAIAEGPTSQFGFQGWPYRQNTTCTQGTCNTACSTGSACDNSLSCNGVSCEDALCNDCQTNEDAAAASESCPAITCLKCGETSCDGYCQGVLPSQCPNAGVCETLPEDVFCTARPQETNAESPAPTATPLPAKTSVPTVTLRPESTPAVKPTSPSSSENYTTESPSAQEQIAWNLLNHDRAANGRISLPLDGELSRLARMKAEDMRDKHYFAHTSPTYGSAADMLRTFGYSFTAVGENIAHHATVEKAQAAFMSSTGHRTNILSTGWTKVGVGVCYDENGYVYVVQIFAR